MGFQGLAGFGGGATGLAAESVAPGGGGPGHDATGGTTTTYTDPSTGYEYKSHTFLTSGSLVINSLSPVYPADIDYLLVAGGGGGGPGYQGGGGGAGGFVEKTNQPVSATTYPVVIGAGGAVQTVGDNTVFNSVTALGGGLGGKYPDSSPGGPGGSGGGGGCYPTSSPTNGGSSSDLTQGNPGGGGGSPYVSPYRGGGGGGASASGTVGGSGSGMGGDGSPNVYRYGPGTPVTYAGGGGGGGGYPSVPGGLTDGAGGAGGGGHGGNHSADPPSTYTHPYGQPGTDNTGGGGGGAMWDTEAGGTGGPGIVVVRYRIS